MCEVRRKRASRGQKERDYSRVPCRELSATVPSSGRKMLLLFGQEKQSVQLFRRLRIRFGSANPQTYDPWAWPRHLTPSTTMLLCSKNPHVGSLELKSFFSLHFLLRADNQPLFLYNPRDKGHIAAQERRRRVAIFMAFASFLDVEGLVALPYIFFLCLLK